MLREAGEYADAQRLRVFMRTFKRRVHMIKAWKVKERKAQAHYERSLSFSVSTHWRQAARSQRKGREAMERAVRLFRNMTTAKAFRSWKAMYGEVLRIRGVRRRAMRMFVLRAAARAFRTWSQMCVYQGMNDSPILDLLGFLDRARRTFAWFRSPALPISPALSISFVCLALSISAFQPSVSLLPYPSFYRHSLPYPSFYTPPSVPLPSIVTPCLPFSFHDLDISTAGRRAKQRQPPPSNA